MLFANLLQKPRRRDLAWRLGAARLPLLKAATVLVPSYGAAWLTGQMIYVVPTLAAAGILAASIGTSRPERISDDGDAESDGGEDTQLDQPSAE